ncbi:hypothetical protein [Caenimonas koreensis]|uniref:hypothetical protein n=1 Tax=Caenimonas koreensis TaxID=367474 RepID=UPI003783CFB0
MSNLTKPSTRFADTPRDKPVDDRAEHANHPRPGAQFHPRARVGWGHVDPAAAWRAR